MRISDWSSDVCSSDLAGRHRGLAAVHHAGAVVGGSCQMLTIVDHDLDIIVMSNGLGGLDLYTLVEEIIETCIPDLPPPDDVPAAPFTDIFPFAQPWHWVALERDCAKTDDTMHRATCIA